MLPHGKRHKISKLFAKVAKVFKKNEKSLFFTGSFPFLMHLSYLILVFDDGIVRASAGASATTDTLVRVDDIDATF